MTNLQHLRPFLRVANFERLQSPKRPKRPTWIKSYTTDLDDAVWLEQSAAVRCFMMEFQKLAATMENRVPRDVRFIAHKVAMRPQVVGVSLSTCIRLGWVSCFVEDAETSEKNDLAAKIATRGNPPSLSTSPSPSTSGSTRGVNKNGNGRGNLRVVGGDALDDDDDIPF